MVQRLQFWIYYLDLLFQSITALSSYKQLFILPQKHTLKTEKSSQIRYQNIYTAIGKKDLYSHQTFHQYRYPVLTKKTRKTVDSDGITIECVCYSLLLGNLVSNKITILTSKYRNITPVSHISLSFLLPLSKSMHSLGLVFIVKKTPFKKLVTPDRLVVAEQLIACQNAYCIMSFSLQKSMFC